MNAGPFYRIIGRIGFFLFLATLIGCGGKKPYPVKGKVTYKDGTPMKGGAVFFEATEPDVHFAVTGYIDMETGAYVLGNAQDGFGAPAGHYRVLVKGRRPNPKAQTRDPELVNQVDGKYLDFKSSGLEFTVEPKANEYDIVIERGPKPKGAVAKPDF